MSGERTEAATPRRLKELRDQGRLSRSQDLTTALGLLAAFTILANFGPKSIEQLRWFMERQLTELGYFDLTAPSAAEVAVTSRDVLLSAVAPLLGLTLVGVACNLGQIGFLVSGKLLAPNLARLNPLANARRLFSLHALVELSKTLVKISLLGYVLFRTYTDSLPTLLALGATEPRAAAPVLGGLVTQLGLTAAALFLGIGAVDYGYQRWDFLRTARMTKDELKQELRQSEGSPQVRARIRQQQRKLASGRMMHEVPGATVVLTNPTHLAVALVYQRQEMAAPRVVAKGAGSVAERIKALAHEHGIPVLENKPLARLLYRRVDIGMEIPADLFQAVAEVLAYIYSLRLTRRKETEHGSGA